MPKTKRKAKKSKRRLGDKLRTGTSRVVRADCREWLQSFFSNKFDACVTDPPYHLTSVSRNGSPRGNNPETPFGRHKLADKGFMGKVWDGGGIAFEADLWREVYRVLKPGAYLLAFGGTRTYHRLACAIEDAGFEIRDMVTWMYGSGFPKSLDVSKAIDNAADYKVQAQLRRDAVQAVIDAGIELPMRSVDDWTKEDHAPGKKWWAKFIEWIPTLTDESQNRIHRAFLAKGHSGTTAFWNTAGGMGDFDITAPATKAAKKWDGWGTALKPAHEPICLARKPLKGTVAANVLKHGTGALNIGGCKVGTESVSTHSRGHNTAFPKRPGETTVEESGRKQRQDILDSSQRQGRWPANVILDEEAGKILDQQSGTSVSRPGKPRHGQNGTGWGMTATGAEYDDAGGASRFFYCAKASAQERGRYNDHPTVKPLDLVRWLCRLITPRGGTVLDPFAGSGTTCMAALLEGLEFAACELEGEYVKIANRRIARVRGKKKR